ncbi:hypothetical protein BKA63DRAFT_608817, partial [Paraphoma chrysanthemicola]
MLSALSFLALFVCAAICPSWVAAAQSARPYAISKPYCPAYPPPQLGSCGPFTHNYCDSNTLTCPFQKKYCTSSASASLLVTEPVVSKDVQISPQAYVYFKMLETEYMVEFAKNPMPGEKPVSLPFCGRPKVSFSRRGEQEAAAPLDEFEDEHLAGAILDDAVSEDIERRNAVGDFFNKGKSVVVQVANPVYEKIKQDGKKLVTDVQAVGKLAQAVIDGIASADIPGLDQAPKYHPRPVCVPRNISVPIHFTLFATNYTTSSQVTVQVLEEQLKVINRMYLDLGIQFFISSFNYHVGEEFRRFAHHKYDRLNGANKNKDYFSYVERVKQENRYGGFDEINVWIVESLSTPDCDAGSFTTGYCTFARQLTFPNRQVDGCVINMATLPNVNFSGLGTPDGLTLAHEIGHWFNLDHIFPAKDGVGCGGESDSIADTFQFPNDPTIKFEAYQPRCCFSGFGKSLSFFPCSGENKTHVTNHMSYSSDGGKLDPNDPAGTRPWTMGQRAHMFASFFTIRRKAPRGGLDGDCLYYPVFKDIGKPASRPRDTSAFLPHAKRDLLNSVLSGSHLFRQNPNLLPTLQKLCATKPTNPGSSAINIVTGEEVQCDGTTCKPPTTGAICADGSKPPCAVIPDPATVETCLDGSTPPCKTNTCPAGTELSCVPIEGITCDEDGLQPPCFETGTEKPVDKGDTPVDN